MRPVLIAMSFTLLVATQLHAQHDQSAQHGRRQVATRATHYDTDQGGEEPLFRHATLHEALATSKANRRPILLYVTSDNCMYCKKMLRRTLGHPQVSRMIAEHTESFAFNASQSPELAQKLGVRGFPTTLLISPERELLCQIDGFVDPQEFAKRVWPAIEQLER